MNNWKFGFSAVGRGRLLLSAALIVVASVIMTFLVSPIDWERVGHPDELAHIIADVSIPVMVSGTVMLLLIGRMQRLAMAHRELEIIASTDSLTTVLNRGAFLTLVEAFLARVAEDRQRGALLVVDADNFKSINDHFGHDKGDEALRLIAASIKGMLRGADIVGRIGGEEFGVFLPGSTLEQAHVVAERIRSTIGSANFMPDGTRHALTVSVGGAVFDRHLAFPELFRVADRQLYLAKSRGRNRTAVATVLGDAGRPMAAA